MDVDAADILAAEKEKKVHSTPRARVPAGLIRALRNPPFLVSPPLQL
jgi:hypothetical protein